MPAYETAGKSDEWYTPRYIFDALNEVFDLDPANGAIDGAHVPCRASYGANGLEREWRGFVWLNPPFGNEANKRLWLQKFFEHGNGIMLMPDRTSARWFQDYAPRATASCFVAPKIKFERADGTVGKQPGTGTVLFASGERAHRAITRSRLGFIASSDLRWESEVWA